MKKYLKIARIDHWIKNLFIIPGTVIAILLTNDSLADVHFLTFALGFLSTCFIASANYVINEWLDAPYDKYHPTKKNRPAVSENMKLSYVLLEYFIFILAGCILASLINRYFLYTELFLLLMGVLYNVKPIRTKDIPYLDVLSESVNNMIRLLLGWFVVDVTHLPPSSILIGYWMGGAFLMATKRFAEYRMINNSQTAGLYRKSFSYYSEKTLAGSALFYGMVATFCIGVFLIKYRIEYLLSMPVIFLLFAYYFCMSYNRDSAAQKPEKLYKEKMLIFLVACVIVVLGICTFCDIPALEIFVSKELIRLK